ncbi:MULTISPECIES: MFS transporter [unclassified Rhodococcus (in: high G+C Gram-positive bacteria)]|uniref:MFS transporter n=1 Tax=unclassified Rhodococcus (in: high G+C Gram-positive bacteria) TaxID=192944 RepID=UPI001639D99F|nr:MULTISPECIES: MFS transporter [unclassified Rhodococcus (in: high G+C Gram-positive bacteria)]MBC2637580.1 MFS transporter [Rhodococcus sp. 3A]MBC2644283.1 MFS transporter [Rhodococcus sp. 3A]MBC2890981.1 MFS transporter [Rhodococcus sp. 4CII]MBC2897674.1 MFS transporter [Rhodococcus sp. 4CII]
MKPPLRVDVEAVVDGAPFSRLQKRTLAICIAIAILDGFDVQSIGFAAPAIAKDWGLPVSAFGLVFSAGLVGMMLGGMAFGPIADRIGRRKVILLCTVGVAVFTLLQTIAPNVETLLALRFVCGIGLGGLTPNLIALASEYAPARRRSTVVTVVVSSMSLGGMVGGFLAAYLIPHYGWRTVFAAGGVLTLIILLIAWRALPESIRFLAVTGQNERAAKILGRLAPAVQADATKSAFVLPEKAIRRSPVRTLFTEHRSVVTILLWIVFGMNLFVAYFLLNWMPSLFTAAGLSASLALVATSLYNFGGVVGGVTIGLIADYRRSATGILAASYLIAAVSIAATATAIGNTALMLIALFVVGFGISGGQTGISAVGADVYPTVARSTGLGWAYGVGRVGSIIGPLVGGFLIAAGLASTTIFSLTIIPTILAAVGIVLLAVRRRNMRITGQSIEPPSVDRQLQS